MNARPSTATSSGDFPSKKPSVLRSTRRSKAGRAALRCSTGETSTGAGPTLSRVALNDRGRSSALGEHRSQRAEGPAPMADAVLLVVGELGHRLVPAGGHEDGVVAEASLAAVLRRRWLLRRCRRRRRCARRARRWRRRIGTGRCVRPTARPASHGAGRRGSARRWRAPPRSAPIAARARRPARRPRCPSRRRSPRCRAPARPGSPSAGRCRGRSRPSPRRRGTRLGSWLSTVTHSTGQSAQMRASSRSLCALREAIASRSGNATAAALSPPAPGAAAR